MIKTYKLTKKYENTLALDKIDLEIPSNSIFVILGPNGAGKTTLISILTTLLRPTSGTAKILEYDIKKNPNEIRRNIGVVFQDSPSDLQLTPSEVLDFQLRLYKIHSEKEELITSTLALLNLTEFSNKKIKTFSLGMKRKVEVARGIIHKPKILFLDEPTIGLDPETRINLWNYFKEINQKYKITIVICTNYMEEADALGTHIAILNKGKLRFTGTKKKFLSGFKRSIIKIKTTDNKKIFENIKQKYKIRIHKEEILIETDKLPNDLQEIITLMNVNNIKLNKIEIIYPKFEDAYLKYLK